MKTCVVGEVSVRAASNGKSPALTTLRVNDSTPSGRLSSRILRGMLMLWSLSSKSILESRRVMEKSLLGVAEGLGSRETMAAISVLWDILPVSLASVTNAPLCPSTNVYNSSVNPIVISEQKMKQTFNGKCDYVCRNHVFFNRQLSKMCGYI